MAKMNKKEIMQKALHDLIMYDKFKRDDAYLSDFATYFKKNLKRSSRLTIIFPGCILALLASCIVSYLITEPDENLVAPFSLIAGIFLVLSIVLFARYFIGRERAIGIKEKHGIRFINLSRARQKEIEERIKDRQNIARGK